MNITSNNKLKGDIRLATLEDAADLLEIYRPFIQNTSITFEYAVPTLEEFTKRIQNIIDFYPWLVYEEEGKILGYAYATPYGVREAYKWSATLSIYLMPEAEGKGVAQYLYNTLLKLLKEQGIYKAYAIVTLPNLKSEKFHLKMGFEKVGIFENIGYKLGEWKNVCYLHYTLKACEGEPQSPIALKDILGKHTLEDYLKINNIFV